MSGDEHRAGHKERQSHVSEGGVEHESVSLDPSPLFLLVALEQHGGMMGEEQDDGHRPRHRGLVALDKILQVYLARYQVSRTTQRGGITKSASAEAETCLAMI